MSDAHPHVAWRLALGERIGRVYAAHPKMGAVVVAGSTGAGWADRHSDIEIHTFWREAPTDDDRRRLALDAGGQDIETFPYEEDEWGDELFVPVPHAPAQRIQVGFSQFLVSTLEDWLDEALVRHHVKIDHQLQIAAVQRSVVVSGHTLIERWRQRTADYPDGLRRAMVLSQLPFYGRWYGVDMLADRDDTLMLIGIFHTVCAQLLVILHGLNRVFIANPDHKWLAETASLFAIKPHDLLYRLRRVFRSPAAEGVATLQALCEETLALVARELPDVDVQPYQRKLRHRRAVIEPPATR